MMLCLRILPLLLTCATLSGQTRALAQTTRPAPEPTLLGSREWTTATPETLARSAERGHVHVELTDGSVVLARRSHQERTRSGGLSWYGTFDGQPGGSVALAFQRDAVAGVVRQGSRLSRIRASAAGSLVTEEHDARGFAPCGIGPEHRVAQALAGSAITQRGDYVPSGSGDTVVDVLVVWTPQAQAIVGGAAAMQALVDLAVLETNVAYDNSGVELDLRLVHSTLVDYGEAPAMGTDLARLLNKTDGYLDEVHPLRDAFGADGVSMIVSGTNPCGVGYLMAFAPSPTFERRAFNVVSYSCATGNYSFGHEFGHNFGLSHDRANTPNTPSQPYAFGYRTPDNAWRTIMAIFQGSRIQYFSTPDRTFGGFPLGIAAPSPDSADNTRALNVNASTIAAWRPTAVPDQEQGVRVLPVGAADVRYVIDDTGGQLGPGTVMQLVFPDGSFASGTPWVAGQRSEVLELGAPSVRDLRAGPLGLLVFRAGRVLPELLPAR